MESARAEPCSGTGIITPMRAPNSSRKIRITSKLLIEQNLISWSTNCRFIGISHIDQSKIAAVKKIQSYHFHLQVISVVSFVCSQNVFAFQNVRKCLQKNRIFVANVNSLVLTDTLRHGWQSFLGTASQCRGLKLLRLVGHFQISTSIKLPGGNQPSPRP